MLIGKENALTWLVISKVTLAIGVIIIVIACYNTSVCIFHALSVIPSLSSGIVNDVKHSTASLEAGTMWDHCH